MSVNQVILVGRVGKDAELAYSKAGHPICKFSLATTEKVKQETQTTWHNIVLFGKFAETMSSMVIKGMQMYVEGKISVSQSEKNGTKLYYTSIIASKAQILGDRYAGQE